MTSNLSFLTLNLNFVHSYLNISVSLSCYKVVFEKSCQKGKETEEKLIKIPIKKLFLIIYFCVGGQKDFGYVGFLCFDYTFIAITYHNALQYSNKLADNFLLPPPPPTRFILCQRSVPPENHVVPKKILRPLSLPTQSLNNE